MERLGSPGSGVNEVALQAALMELAPGHRAYVESRMPPGLRRVMGPDDILQEVWVTAFRDFGAARVTDRKSLAGWTMTLVKRRLLDQIRATRRLKRGREFRPLHDAAPASRSVAQLLDQLALTTTTPSRRFASKEAEFAVRIAIAGLPEHQRQALWLHYFEGLKLEQIAQRTGRTVGSVKMLLKRSRDAMRESLGRASRFFSESGFHDRAG